MQFSVLGSGSRGNAVLIATKESRLLIDGGFSGKEIARRLALIGCDPQSLDAILVTHEHEDHISGVGVLSRRYKLPVYANPATHRAASHRVKKLSKAGEFATGQAFNLQELHIHPFAVSHDAADPVGYTISDGSVTIGYCTDTGCVSRHITHRLQQCQGLILEANHDPQMLRDGPYPLRLQQRIRSNKGHLANATCGALVRQLASAGLNQVVLAHLSESNNLPELAFAAVQQELGSAGGELQIRLARQDQPTPLIALR
jgi:phosphoribosyl 1,2-cyclic phosphodiesterase